VNLAHAVSCRLKFGHIVLVHNFGCLVVFVAVSQLPGLRLVLFLVSKKAVTRPGIDEGVICVGVWLLRELVR